MLCLENLQNYLISHRILTMSIAIQAGNIYFLLPNGVKLFSLVFYKRQDAVKVLEMQKKHFTAELTQLLVAHYHFLAEKHLAKTP